jgi:hypothetical protein
MDDCARLWQQAESANLVTGYHALHSPVDRAALEDLLRDAGLAEHAHRPVKDLDSGHQRALQVALAFAGAAIEHGGEVNLSVGRTCPFYLLEIEGLLTPGSRPGRTFGESVGGILEMDSSDWSSGIRHHTFDTRPDTEFNENKHSASFSSHVSSVRICEHPP